MSYLLERQRRLVSRLTVCAAALALWPVLLFGQEGQATPTEKFSSVTEEYTFEGLLPLLPQAVADGAKGVTSWCKAMAKSLREHSGETSNQIDHQREAKKAEIKVLENRAKAAEDVKDEALKKETEKMVEYHKLDLDILDSVKDMSEAENEAANDLEKAGEALDQFVGAYGDLSGNRRGARGIDYAMNEKALKSFEEAGSKLKDAGERLNKVAKARQELNKAWQKRLEANISK